jgi:alkanesulfonate monooxygenase SsuD/methylene tetrahydromethanopterin reductase-like flavin-dependent oxidoreductase (luciferase family)
LLKHDPSLPDAAVDLEYVADHLWLVGSPGTVAERIRGLQEQTGGFGYLLAVSYDAADERTAWERHLDLLIHEVLPACSEAAVMEPCR